MAYLIISSSDCIGSSHYREKFNLANNSRNKKLSSEVGKRDFQIKKLEAMLNRADKFYENGSYIKAIDEYTQVDQIDNRKENLIDKNDLMEVKFRTTAGMMACHFQLYELDKANKYFTTAVSYAEDICERSLIAKCYNIKANICIREEKYDEALNYCDKAITYLDQKEGLTLYTIIEHDAAKVLILQHKYEQAWNIYIQSLQSQLKSISPLMKKDSKRSECLDLVHSDQLISEKNLSNQLNKVENCLREKEKKRLFLALLYDTAGNIFYLQSNYRVAIIQYLKSYRIKEKILKSQDYLLLISNEYLSKAYFASDQLDDAEKHYKFLTPEENCKGRNDYCERFKAKLKNVLGEICFKKGEYDTSISYYEYSKTFYSSSDRSEHEVELSKTLYGIGRVYQAKGEFEQALSMFEKSLKIQITISGHRGILGADTMDSIAEVYEKQNQLEEAQEWYETSFILRERVCQSNNLDLVSSYYSETRLEKYRRSDDKMLGSEKYMTEKDSLRQDQARIYEQIGKMLGLFSDYLSSQKMYQKALDMQNSLSEKNQINVSRLTRLIDKIAEKLKCEANNNCRTLNHCNEQPENPPYQPGTKIQAYRESEDKGYSQQMANRKTFISLKTKGKYHPSKVPEQLATSSSSDHSQSELSEQKTTARKSANVEVRDKSSILIIARTAIREFKEAFETALDRGEFSNNFANIMLIGPNHEDKSFIYKLLTKQPESSPNATPVLINLDTIKQASNSDEKIILDRQSFIDSKVLSVIEKQGNISPNPELQRIFSSTLEIGNNQPSDKSRIAISSSDKIIVDNIDIDYPVNNNDNEITTASDNIISLLNETTKSLSSPSFSRCFQKFHQSRKYYHDNQFAKIWNFNNHAYYQPFKFQHNVYIAPFDVSIKLDKIVSSDYGVGRHDYMTSFQEWLINAIDWNTKENQSYISIDSQEDEIPLPIILFVATNSDDKLTEEAQWTRRSQFMDELDMKMPQYKSHFYSPEIIINTVGGNQSKDLEETVNSSSWNKLCEKIQNCILDVPFFKQKIKLKWYIMAELFDNPILVSDRIISHSQDKQNSTGMQYIQTLEQVYAKARNRMEQSEIINVLKFLHGIGEIIFSQYCETDSLIVTELSWFYDNFRKISTLVDNYKQRHLASSSKSREYCKWARDYGIVTKASVKCAISHEALMEEDIDSLLQVMERNRLIYKASRNLEDIKASMNEQYFFPHLLSSRKKEADSELRYGFQSPWLYLGFDKNSPLYVTDQIFHQFLLSSQSELDVELYYHSAKYLPKHRNYTIIVEKSGSHIRIQYYYETVDESKEDDQITLEEISKLLSNDQLHVYFKTMLSKIVKDVHPERQEIDCGYFFPCLKCDQLIPFPIYVEEQIITCTNVKCLAKPKLADMKAWNSVLFSSRLPCNDIKSTLLNQESTSPDPSTLSTCDAEDTAKSSADREDENQSDYDSIADSSLQQNSGENLKSTSPFCGTKRKRNQLDSSSEDSKAARGRLDSTNDENPDSPPSLSSVTPLALEHCRAEFERKNSSDETRQTLRREFVLIPAEAENINGKQNTTYRSEALREDCWRFLKDSKPSLERLDSTNG
ncbi:hypothetical protein TrispH2_010658 [Trichoplax sp. H2]|nr:hypothetical protein TrispH2_010658 [Trichoplax sp. H2]|eukprot:RDD37558.1 hypothetical protein TrispH2_010658 [Trichoplax sp. H2]